MPIKAFEFYHGAFLTRLLRKDVPTTLALVETNIREAWSLYKVTDTYFYVKHSTNPKKYERFPGRLKWDFTFSSQHINQIKKYLTKNLYVALVCSRKDINNDENEICIINTEQLLDLVGTELELPNYVISVICEKSKSFRVKGTNSRKKEFTIYRNKIDLLEI